MKVDRVAVYNKYKDSNGTRHCAYCGKPITLSTMQVDHIIPKARGWKVADVNDISNLNPACRSCNHYKRAHSLEDFRKHYLGQLHKRLERIYTVRVAIDYGIVELNKWDRRFFFEKVGK
jgi:5-methylcytosine-specific restriction endonuclease McrA